MARITIYIFSILNTQLFDSYVHPCIEFKRSTALQASLPALALRQTKQIQLYYNLSLIKFKVNSINIYVFKYIYYKIYYT